MIDIHTFLGQSIQGYSQTEDDLLRLMDASGVERAVICPVKPQGYHLWPENERVAEAAQRRPDRFTGFARIDPRQGEAAVDDLRRAVRDLGLRGLFLHPWEETFCVSEPLLMPVMEAARELEIPVMIAAAYPFVSDALQIGRLAGLYPEVPIIMTNGGQINISGRGQHDARLVLEEHPNVFLHTAGVYREDFIEEVSSEVDPGRVLFGSSSPIFDMRFEVLRVRRAHLLDDIKERLARGNAERLLSGGGQRRA